MRRRWWLAAGLVPLGAVLWLVLSARPEAGATAPEPSRNGDTQAASVLKALLWASPPASASGEASLAIQGTVLGPKGPVPGARVLATTAVEGEALSTLSCEGIRNLRLVECLFGPQERLVREWVEQRRGEVPVRAETVTGADGSFSLAGLEAGPYALWVESAEGIGFRPDILAGTASVELRLSGGSRFSGTVTDETKVPVPGALVTAVFTSHSRFFEALTDATGHFQLGPLPPGEFLVVITKKDLLTAVEPLGTYRAEVKRDFELFRPRSITGRVLRASAPVAGAEVHYHDGVDLRGSATTDASGRFSFEGLSPASYELSAWQAGSGAFARIEMESTQSANVTLELKPGILIEGVVRDEDHQPLKGVEVDASWKEMEAPTDEAEASDEWEPAPEPEEVSSNLGIAYTDEEGRYRLGPLPPGWYSFRASVRGYHARNTEAREFTVGAAVQDFTLARAPLIEGVVVDSEGLPVEGESLRVSLSEKGAQVLGYDTTGPDGHFSFAVWPDTFRVFVEGKRLHPLQRDITVPTEPLRLVGERLLRLSGEVVDAAGTPLPGVEVALWPETASVTDRRLVDGSTNGKGQFSLHVTTPGRYKVVAESVGRGFLRTTSQLVEVDGKSESRVYLRFAEGRDLPVVLVDWRGRPVPKALLLLVAVPRPVNRFGCSSPNICVETDAEGRFTFEDISGEEFDICVRTDGLVPLARVHGETRCVRAKNDGQEVRIVVGRDVFVTGRLVHPDGSPVTHYRVNGREVRRDDGELSLPIQRPGEEPIELSAPGLQTVLRTAPEFPEGSQIEDIGTIVLSP